MQDVTEQGATCLLVAAGDSPHSLSVVDKSMHTLRTVLFIVTGIITFLSNASHAGTTVDPAWAVDDVMPTALGHVAEDADCPGAAAVVVLLSEV